MFPDGHSTFATSGDCFSLLLESYRLSRSPLLCKKSGVRDKPGRGVQHRTFLTQNGAFLLPFVTFILRSKGKPFLRGTLSHAYWRPLFTGIRRSYAIHTSGRARIVCTLAVKLPHRPRSDNYRAHGKVAILRGEGGGAFR